MPRTYTALVVQTREPDAFHERISTLVDTEEWSNNYEETAPRDPVEGRLRYEFSGRTPHRGAIDDAIEQGDLGPLEWAILSWTLDEAIGVHAKVYEGGTCIDEFEGARTHSGADTEAYLERYHGVSVESAGPYRTSPYYHPSIDIARPEIVPDKTLTDDPPTGPFTIEDANDWLIVEGRLDNPHAFAEGYSIGDDFVDWLRVNFREEGLVLVDRGDLVDRPWVTDGATDLVREQPSEDEPGRVRVRVPLTGVAVNDEGPRLGFGPGSYDGDVDWVVFCYGDGGTGQVDGYVYLADSRFTFEDGIDAVRGDEGRYGADVAAYFRHYYGWQIDPTPDSVDMPTEPDVVPERISPPSSRTATRLLDSGLKPGPEMPPPDN
ncbi:hypothetical protein [Haloarcula halophila]|uniref:hypothetical protein n=1 Tax=Haloarcula TaxID=2237 RepID=UPI0023E3B132|nr:hypothetical protein [Halomicroarcula sp. DFY41]